MKKLLLSLLILAFMAGTAEAITSYSRVNNVSYTTADIIIETTGADSGVTKIVWFKGTSPPSMARYDSLTSFTAQTADTINISGLENGTTYYWYVAVTDTLTTIYEPTDLSGYSFTTTDFTQNLTITTGYSTALMIHDSVGYYVAPLDSLVFWYGKTSGSLDIADTITSVTHPDSNAVTALDEGITYYAQTIAYLADSAIVDTSAEFSFTTTDLGSVISVLRFNLDSLILIIDSTTMCPETLIVQWGAGLAAITANADTTATPNCPDTVILTGIIEGSTIFYRALGLLVDSAVVDTGTIGTYTRPHNSFIENARFEWPSNSRVFLHWDFDSHTDTYSTGTIPITSAWLRIHVSVDGEDDWATSDSINVFLNSYDFGDLTAIDTLVTLEPDTGTITPLKYRMYPGDLTDSSLTYYPEFDWGTHYSVTASMSNDDGQADSATALGIRSVHVVIEEIQ